MNEQNMYLKYKDQSWSIMTTSQPTPTRATYSPTKKALLRASKPLVSLNKALLNPYFWGGGVVD